MLFFVELVNIELLCVLLSVVNIPICLNTVYPVGNNGFVADAEHKISFVPSVFAIANT